MKFNKFFKNKIVIFSTTFILLTTLLICVVVLNLNKKNDANKNLNQTVIQSSIYSTTVYPTVSAKEVEFRSIKKGETIDDVVRKIGSVGISIGSGLSIILYNTSDGKSVHVALSIIDNKTIDTIYVKEKREKPVLNTNSKRILKLDDFSKISSSISYDNLIATIGLPDEEICIDRYCPEYVLNDGNTLFFEFYDRTQLFKAIIIKPDRSKEDFSFKK